MQQYSEWFALVVSIGTFFGGMLAWYRGNVQKSYAAERDFNHLKDSLAQIEMNLLALNDNKNDRLNDITRELVEVKGLIHALSFNLRGSTTEGFYGPDRDRR